MTADTPHDGPMTEQRARLILGRMIVADDTLNGIGEQLVWFPHGDGAMLDGDFTADELEAIAWWMRNKNARP